VHAAIKPVNAVVPPNTFVAFSGEEPAAAAGGDDAAVLGDSSPPPPQPGHAVGVGSGVVGGAAVDGLDMSAMTPTRRRPPPTASSQIAVRRRLRWVGLRASRPP
jgi:hypothetical protein